MPTHIDEIRIHGRPGPHLWSHAQLQEREADTIKGEVRLLDEAGHAVVEIVGLRFESLRARYTSARVEENPDDWLYEFQWQSHDRLAKDRPDNEHLANERSEGQRVSQPSAPASPGRWLIFADNSGVGEALAARLEGAGRTEHPGFARRIRTSARTVTHFRIRPEQPEDLRRLFAAALPSNQSACRGIVHLWSLDAPAASRRPTYGLADDGPDYGLRQLRCRWSRNWSQAESREPTSSVAGNARALRRRAKSPLPLDVAQAPLWGMGRVIAQEHAALWGGLVDLETGGSGIRGPQG